MVRGFPPSRFLLPPFLSCHVVISVGVFSLFGTFRLFWIFPSSHGLFLFLGGKAFLACQIHLPDMVPKPPFATGHSIRGCRQMP